MTVSGRVRVGSGGRGRSAGKVRRLRMAEGASDVLRGAVRGNLLLGQLFVNGSPASSIGLSHLLLKRIEVFQEAAVQFEFQSTVRPQASIIGLTNLLRNPEVQFQGHGFLLMRGV